LKVVVSVVVAIALSLLSLVPAASAADMVEGAKVFSANCAACHLNGGNLVNGAKTLKKSDLEKYEMASLEAIKTQVTNGKLAMPAFRGRLNAGQIENVAAYVLTQAESGW